MKFKISVMPTDDPCCDNRITINIPGLKIDFWVCVEITASFWIWHWSSKWALNFI